MVYAGRAGLIETIVDRFHNSGGLGVSWNIQGQFENSRVRIYLLAILLVAWMPCQASVTDDKPLKHVREINCGLNVSDFDHLFLVRPTRAEILVSAVLAHFIGWMIFHQMNAVISQDKKSPAVVIFTYLVFTATQVLLAWHID